MISEMDCKLERQRESALAAAMASVIALGLVVDVRHCSGVTIVAGEQGCVSVEHAANGGAEAATLLAVKRYMDEAQA